MPSGRSRELEQVEPRRARARSPRRRVGSPSAERPEVRRPPEQHVLGDGHPGGHQRRLRHDRDRRATLAPRSPRLAPPSSGIDPRVADEPGDRPQERRLARAVRADQRHPLARLDRELDAVDDVAAAELDRDAVQLERAHARPPRVVRSTIAKNGAPKNAVTTPIGISAGASAVRAITSARTRKPGADEHRQRQQRR